MNLVTQHLSEVVNGNELDLPEKQLGFAVAFDYELDNFAASVGFARQAVLDMVANPGKFAAVIVKSSRSDLTPGLLV